MMGCCTSGLGQNAKMLENEQIWSAVPQKPAMLLHRSERQVSAIYSHRPVAPVTLR